MMARRTGASDLEVALGADALPAAHGPIQAARVALPNARHASEAARACKVMGAAHQHADGALLSVGCGVVGAGIEGGDLALDYHPAQRTLVP